MRAIVYDIKPLGWLACKCLKSVWPGCLSTGLNGLSLREIAQPALPGPDWVRVRTLLGGICGTDLAILQQKQLPNSILQAYSSMPMLLGHENVAVVEETGPAADKSWKGRRVCVEPTLGCTARGIQPLCDRCKAGEFGSCENFGSSGLGAYKLPAGTSIGYNNTTGGSFGESFVAHQSQLVPLDEKLSDEDAALTDPLACSLHAAMRVDISSARQILIYGAGVLGLGLAASLRAIGYRGKIDAIDRADYLAPIARSLGVDEFLRLPVEPAERFAEIARRTGATVQESRFRNYMLSGGYDVVFDCVGVRQSIEECLKWTRARGQVVFVATGHGGGADLTPIWFRELTIFGAYGRQLEHFEGWRIGTYQLVHKLMAEGKLKTAGLLTHKFRLADYHKAFDAAMNKSENKAVKVAFDFR